MARSRWKPGGDYAAVLVTGGAASSSSVHSGSDDPIIRKCIWRVCNCVRSDGRHPAHCHDSDRGPDPRRRSPQSGPWVCDGHGNGLYHGDLIGRIFLAPEIIRKVVAIMARLRRIPWWSWFWFLLGVIYFVLPLYATLDFSLSMQRDKISLLAYEKAFADKDFIQTFTYSNLLALATIIFSIVLIVPTAYWIRLRLPEARRVTEFITLMPFVVPAIILVFGLIRIYSSPIAIPFTGIQLLQPLTTTHFGTNILIVAGYM